MKKYLIILICLIMLTGCSTTAELTISGDDKVSEKIYVSEEKSKVDDSGMSLSEYVDSTLDYFDKSKFSSYNISNYTQGNKAVALFSKESRDLCSSINTSVFKDFFEAIECNETNKYYEFTGKINESCDEEECYESIIYDNIKITINLSEKAIKSNADSIVDTKYTWNIDGKNNKDIYLKIKKNRVDNKTSTENNIRNRIVNNNKNMIIILLVGSILIILLAAIVLYDKYKKNKIDY